MHHEEQPPHEPSQPEPERALGWDSHEQTGDIYEVAVDGDGGPTIEKIADNAPRIWVGSLSDYNNGVLYGDWIDAARGAAEIHREIQAMLAKSPTTTRLGEVAEEWGIFDHEGFGEYLVHEYAAIEHVAAMARGITEHGLAYAAWASISDDETAADTFTGAYLGHYESVHAYVEQYAEDGGYEKLLDRVVPDHLRPYVQLDIEGLARDLELGGDVTVVRAEAGGVWLFDGHQ